MSLSCKDSKFLDIIETGVHKNEQGNWEMFLPFRRKDPQSSRQTLKRPHSHLKKKASDGERLHGVHGEDHRRPRFPGANRRTH